MATHESETAPSHNATTAHLAIAADGLCTLREVQRLYPRSRTALWRAEHAGRFPRSVRINGRLMWVRAEVVQWIAAHITAARDKQHESQK